MFRIILSCMSELWKLLCESLSSTPTSQTSSVSPLDSIPSTTISQTPFSPGASGTLPSTSSHTDPSSAASDSPPSKNICQAPSSTISCAIASTSSQTPTPTSWGVFLSFRGVDTRNNFTSHLYNRLVDSGFPTFMDDPELRSGEVISDALFQAIQDSKIYVVVFSENYASSAWCLDELVEILNCYKSKQRLVIPVFYNIKPAVVRYQTDKFKEAFEIHPTRFAQENVKKWRDTLREVSLFSGHHITRDGRSEADIVAEIINRITLDMNPKTLDVAKYPVGLDSRVKDIMSWMSTGIKGVIKIGIYGMGGMGKTTLAKALFNQLLLGGRFKGSCFLANVRDASGNYKGIESLQQKLINEVLKSNKTVEVHNVEEGAKLIRERICSAKLLVLVDDIYDRSQYESLVGPFASGSVVIITTRDEEMLDKIKVEPRYRYRVNELNDEESLSLFTKHAFENGEQDNTLMVLSKHILRLAGGLPLALEVFGAYLSTQPSEVGWKSYIEKLQRDPDSNIQQKLIISVNAIELEDPLLKQIFLDIACFFIGNVKKDVVKIMETCYLYADHKIDILKKRCLLTIDGDMFGRNELGMHDLLQDVGREIARNKSANEPGNYSRLWAVNDICEVLENQSGTKAIECIIYNDGGYGLHGVAVTTKTFKRMSKLRFLKIGDVNLTGSFEHIFKDLRWLCWDSCPLKCLPSEFYPQKLVILELPRSNIRSMWELNMVSHVFGKLKTLNMSNSQNLSTIADFTRVPCLETLNLHGCSWLEEVHMSIGSLGRLVSLDLHGCGKLRSLPDSICNLTALKVLTISQCISLEALPIQLGNLISLTKLNAQGLTVSKLPDSIGHLTKLVKLNLRNNKNLKTLPDSICNLRSLEILSIDDCRSVKALPTAIGNIKSLKKSNASGLTISKLPDSIGSLTKLVELNLSYNRNLEALPDTICNLSSLEILDIDGCSSVKALPMAIGNIESLKKINVKQLAVSKFPDSFGHLTKLVELDLSNNWKLETLPETICNLRSLEALNIYECRKLEILPDQLWKITRLRKLAASYATKLKRLPDIGSSQIALSLQQLDLTESGFITLPSGFSKLSNLQSLHLRDSHHLLSIPKCPPNLKHIDANDCESLERLPNLSNLKHLETLNLEYCSGLTEILGFEKLIALRDLNLSGCEGLTEIQGLEKLSALRDLHLRGCGLTSKHLPKRLFKVYIEFGHLINVYVSEIQNEKIRCQWPDWILESPYWTSESTTVYVDLQQDMWTRESKATLYAHLLQNESHNFMGIILCFRRQMINASTPGYAVKNTTSGFILTDSLPGSFMFDTLMVIVPKSIFSVRDDDHSIELTANNVRIVGIHILYKTETKILEDVVGKHVIDIDTLKLIDPVLLDIFLDIACLFVGWKKTKVVQILETYYTNVHQNIDILKKTCLLKISDEDELEMDDLLQRLGRKMARNNSLDEPEKHSRLWLLVDIYEMFKNHKGTEVIEGIVPRKVTDALEGESFTLKTFQKMRKLRFLYLKMVHLSGSFEQTFEDLRWLCWDCCPLKCLPSEFYPPKLVILELPHSNIITMWELNMVSHVFEKLKTLDMSYSQDLTTISDFTKLPCLETLNLKGCESLEEIHTSIGKLMRLVSLDLHGCVNLRSLPDTICNLKALEVLDICDCCCLEALPAALGNIQSLTELNAENLIVSVLPDSIGHLSKLVKLRLSGSKNLETLPNTICNMGSLEILDVSGCKKLEIFPHVESSQIALSLQKLNFSKSALTALPSSISQFSNLEDLNLEDCHRLLSIAELPFNLKWIRAHGCTSMERLPNLSNLKHLEYLNLEDCSGLTDIQELTGLTSIRRLHLEGCNSSLLAYIFTESFFQMYTEFGHPIHIYAPLAEFPDWISQSSEFGSTMSLNLPPNVSHHFLGMILCFKSSYYYFVKNTRSGFIWRGSSDMYCGKSLMVIVPRSIFSVEDGDDRIELITEYGKIYGIHLLYKTEECHDNH